MAPSITITNPKTRRERILAFGAPGAGKSYMWQCILAATPPEVRFFVLDTDGAWETAADSPEFGPHADRVDAVEPFEWTDYTSALKRFFKLMDRDRGDWFVLDMADEAWSSAQEFYEDRKYPGDPDDPEFFAKLVDGNIDEGKDDVMGKWGTINKLYSPMRSFLVKAPGNVFVTATAKELKKDKKGNYFRESTDTIRDFGGIGHRPGGQKNLSHDLNTVLYLTKRGNGSREFRMTKDRNREPAWEGEITRTHNDASRDLLMSIAGWEPMVSKGE